MCQAENGMECKLLEGRMRVAYNVSSFFNIQIGTHTSRQVIPGLGTSGSNSVFIKCKQPWKFIREANNSQIFTVLPAGPKEDVSSQKSHCTLSIPIPQSGASHEHIAEWARHSPAGAGPRSHTGCQADASLPPTRGDNT